MPCLFRACQKGDLAVVVQHVSLNFPGPKVANNAASALYIACCEGHTDIVRILMDSQQFDPNQKNYRGYSPLYAAYRKHHMDIFQMLLVDPRTDVNTIWVEEEENRVYDFSDEVVMLLLQHKSFDINRPFWMEQKIRYRLFYERKTRSKKTTFLQHAIENRALTMFTIIMKHPLLNPNICVFCEKPIIIAAHEEKANNIGMFRALVRHPKTRPNALNKDGKTLFHQIVLTNHWRQIYEMLSHCPQIKLNIPDSTGKTLLDFCDEKWLNIINQQTISKFFMNLYDNVVKELGTKIQSTRKKLELSRQFSNMTCREQMADWSKSTKKKMFHYLMYIAKRLFHTFMVVQEDPVYWDKKIEDAFQEIRSNWKVGQMLYTFKIVRIAQLPHEMFKEIVKWF